MKSKANQIFESLIFLDALGPIPNLKFKGHPRFSTVPGILATFLALLISILSVQFTITGYLYKINSDVIMNPIYSEEKVLINSTNFPFYITYISFNQTNQVFIPRKKLETLAPSIMLTRMNLSGLYLIQQEVIPLTSCSDDIFGEEFNTGFIEEHQKYTVEQRNTLKEFAYCLPNNISYQIDSSVNTEDTLIITIPRLTMNNLLSENPMSGVTLSYRQAFLNPDNFNDYYRKIWKTDFFIPDINFSSRYKMEVENYYLKKDHTDLIFENSESVMFINVKRFQQHFQYKALPIESDITWIAITKGEYATSVLIKYKSLNDILAGFGGTFQVMAYLSQIILNLIINNWYSSTLINEVFNFHIISPILQSNQYLVDKVKHYKHQIIQKNKSKTIQFRNLSKNNKQIEENIFDHEEIDRVKEIYLSPLVRKKVKKEEEKKVMDDKLNINKRCSTTEPDEKFYQNYIHSEIDKESETLINEIESICSNKLIKKIYCWDYTISKLLQKSFCRRNNKYKVHIENCEKIIAKHTEYPNFIKFSIDFEILKDTLLNKFEQKFSSVPSTNLNNKHCDKRRKISNNNAKTDNLTAERNILLQMIFKTDMNVRKNRKLLSNFLKSNL
jgi:hypothetical protein